MNFAAMGTLRTFPRSLLHGSIASLRIHFNTLSRTFKASTGSAQRYGAVSSVFHSPDSSNYKSGPGVFQSVHCSG